MQEEILGSSPKYFSSFAVICWVALFATPTTSVAGELITSWRQVEQELSPSNAIINSLGDLWTNSTTLRRLVAQRNTNAIFDLAIQNDLPRSRYSAYFALRTFDVADSLEVGLQIAMKDGVSLLLPGEILLKMQSDLPNPAFKNALTHAFRAGPIKAENVDYLLHFFLFLIPMCI